MLDLGTFCGVPHPLGVVPPGSGHRSRLHDVTPTRSWLGMNILLRNRLALFPGSREAGCYLPIWSSLVPVQPSINTLAWWYLSLGFTWKNFYGLGMHELFVKSYGCRMNTHCCIKIEYNGTNWFLKTYCTFKKKFILKRNCILCKIKIFNIFVPILDHWRNKREIAEQQ